MLVFSCYLVQMKAGNFRLDSIISLQLPDSKVISRIVETGTEFPLLNASRQDQRYTQFDFHIHFIFHSISFA